MRRVLPTLLCVALLASACSDDDSTSDTVAADGTLATTAAADAAGATSSPAADESAFCAALDELEASGDALRDVDVVAQGTDGLQAAFNDLKDTLAAVRESAGDGLRETLDAVGAAFDGLQDGVQDADTPLAKGDALVSGLTDLQTALQDLRATPEAARCT